MTLANGEHHPTQAGFALTSLLFGIVALITWKWSQIGPVVAVMAIGFGIVAIRSTRRSVAGIGILLGAAGFILGLTTIFLNWP